MHRKRLLLMLAVVIGFIGLSFQVAEASVTYTNGMPKQLVGKRWRTKIKRSTGRDGYAKGFPKFVYAKATKHSFGATASGGNGEAIYSHVSYYKEGTRHWFLAGDSGNKSNAFNYFEVKLSKNHRTLKFSNMFTDKTWNDQRRFYTAHQFTHFPKWHGHAVR
ncbi:hypothetical protein [Levilactobacillus cerevisiae]|uniref:hypothetical protein n=1 Tax=Levilactobacillus cerevisiae TaxID=1704076 RepID=UPI000F79E503|nr:hypothetical protein [Levilactobacillus cerevisiae]